MWRTLLLAGIGLSAGIGASIGLFALVVGLGVISDLADRTHTGRYVALYEDCLAVGAIAGNLFLLFQISLPLGKWFLAGMGLLIGIFVGCWAMALAEVLKVFPILIRRIGMVDDVPYLFLAIALGKLCGELLFFYCRW